MSVAQATDYNISKSVFRFQDNLLTWKTVGGIKSDSLLLNEGYKKRRNRSARVRLLTTQKVSHPPVKPKYGALAPARRLLNRAMANRVSVNVEHE